MSIAERAYEYRNGKRNETEDDREWRLVRLYNRIFNGISKINNAQDYLAMQNSIDAYASEVGNNSFDVQKLTRILNKRIAELQEEIQKNIDALNAEIEKIKADNIIEPAERLQELYSQAEHRLLQFMLQLGTNNDGNIVNRRKVGNWVTQADRVNAVALMKLSALPQYADCFTTKQKNIILEKSKNPAEIIWERNKESMLQEKYRKLGKLYMSGFHIRNVLKQISKSNGEGLFK